MFSRYQSMALLAILITIFTYCPFNNFFSNDVWVRLARITEWVEAGFPLKEQLMQGQNYPFGVEMHWTRPLDYIGYIFAWPFIPAFGLHNALEFMCSFLPVLVLCGGVVGFFYGVRGYLTPKAAFFSFILFSLGTAWVWGQGNPGYFDHHVFHYSLLIWAIACILRALKTTKNTAILCLGGFFTALGTWITPEFFINSYLLLTPFIFLWLKKNKPLLPAFTFSVSYTLFLFFFILLDPPMAGWTTLDLYRPSLLHVYLGGMNTLAIWGLSWVPIKSIGKKLFYGTVFATIYFIILLFLFAPYLLQSMTHPAMDYWLNLVGEMQPLYKDSIFKTLPSLYIPVIVAQIALFYAFTNKNSKHGGALVLSATGLIFYLILFSQHIRVGISVDAFFLFTTAFLFNLTFFPKEKNLKASYIFILLYGLFFLFHFKSTAIIRKMNYISVDLFAAAYQQDNSITIPKHLKEAVLQKVKLETDLPEETEEKSVKDEKNTEQELHTALKSCSLSKKMLNNIAKQEKGGIFAPIFYGSEILWKTGFPILSGPYHTNIAGATAIKQIITDKTKDFKTAKKIIAERKLKYIYVIHPYCLPEFRKEEDTKEKVRSHEGAFYHSLFFQTADMPKWVKLIYTNKDTNEKLFEIILDEK